MSVRRRGDSGSWIADLKIKGRRLRRTFTTRREAEEWYARHLPLVESELPGTGLTVERLAERWYRVRAAGLATSRRGPVRPETLRNDRESIAAMRRSGLARVRVDHLDGESILQHREHRARAGASVPSSNRELRVLKGLLTWALAEHLIESMPPVQLVGLSSVREDIEPTTLSEVETEALLDACDPQLRAVCALALYAGLRRSEILTLRGRDLHLDLDGGGASAVVRVVAKKLDPEDSDGTWRPKSKQRRTVPVSKRLWDELSRYFAACGQPGRDDWLFRRATDGGRLRTLEDRLRRAYYRAGIDRERGDLLHVLRRTWATRLAGAGVNAEVVRRLGGWSSLDVVQRSYFSTQPDEIMRSAIEKAAG
jgi:integrase